MNDLKFKPDEYPLATLADVDKLLITADVEGRRVIGLAINHIVRNGPSQISLRYLEGRYRALSSQTYLLGAPRNMAPPNTEARSIRTGKRTNYYLRICVNGVREADQMMMQFNITDAEDNLARLTDTGILIMKRAHPP
jgi:hypothetical protein